MKSVRIAGLCLAAMFVMSMVAAGTASATPHWEVCLTEHSGTTTTKWTSSQCATAKASGGFEWSEPTHTEKVVSHASLTLTAKELGVTVAIHCVGNDEGWVGPNGTAETTKVTVEKCEKGENCEEITTTPKAIHLPWNTELKETESKVHATVRGTGSGAPGWLAGCKVILKGAVENECTSEEGLLVLENKDTPGVLGALLVSGQFTNKPKAKCNHASEGGEVLGNTAFLLASGGGLRVSLPALPAK